MRSRHYILSVALMTFAIAGCHSPAPRQSAPIAHRPFTADTDAVISASERPTMVRVVSKTSGRDIVPGIDIYPDGRCFVRRFDGTELEKRITLTEVSDLLGFLDRSGFFRLTALQIQAQVEVAQHLPGGGILNRGVTDAHYTAVFARTTSKTNHIERYALDDELEWYPEIADLRLMRDAFRRIHETVGETRWWWR